jgi:hypothetical protein
MDEQTIEEWMDRHHVEIVRTDATTLEGASVGKYLNRPKFLRPFPDGHNIAYVALVMDITGSLHLTFWHDFRHGQFGDIVKLPISIPLCQMEPTPTLATAYAILLTSTATESHCAREHC